MTTSTARPASARTIVVARQPIVDRAGDVVAYELLFRSDDPDAYLQSGEDKTAQVLSGTISAGLERMSQNTRLFCNADRGVLTGSTPLVLPPHSTTVEVLETVDIDDEVVAGCRDLVAQGFEIALDDFVWTPRAPELLELATVVKIDLLAHSPAEVSVLADRCRPYDVTLLAEKVETSDELEWAKAMGFELFQGYAIERPQEVRAETVAPSTITLLELASYLAGGEVSFDELDSILRHDPGLSLQALQLATVGFEGGLKRQVRSVHEALVLMGTARVSKWVSLAVLSSAPIASPDGYVQSLTRARACELLARLQGIDGDFAFTAGMLSSLDLLLGVDAESLAAKLEIDADLKAAAFAHEGPVGLIVALAKEHESEARRVRTVVASTQLDVVQAEAFGWAVDQAHAVLTQAA